MEDHEGADLDRILQAEDAMGLPAYAGRHGGKGKLWMGPMTDRPFWTRAFAGARIEYEIGAMSIDNEIGGDFRSRGAQRVMGDGERVDLGRGGRW
ncbi:hypothetical protein B5F40_00510 [Gordonibacter sp. An230]|uniref:hypothetical protein n=1 Tax=Gordonibacter sp. An230 TaxID=1965592 RepID=UPI000B386CC4|nr:hypothetical protein [Gordonibacter sp. An230]OUO92417.1 hypothetical protein B5F40_00510 [Gordonibacter sp. An230]